MSAAVLPLADEDGLEIVVEADAWLAQGLDLERLARAAFAAACAEIGANPGRPAAVLFADDAALRRLNAQHRGKDKPTNVLSFPAAPIPGALEAQPLGDVAVALETVRSEAADLGVTLEARTLHMLVHGCLHLHGYDHEAEAEAEAMEALEARALARLGVADPYEVRDHG